MQGRTDRLINDGPRIQDWISARSGLHKAELFQGIAREVNGQIVAAFGYDWFQGKSCMLHTACDVPWGYSRLLLFKAFDAPFTQWGYNVLMSAVETGNVKSRNIAERLGFTEFGTLPEAHETGALHFVRMYKKDCRWLQLARRIR